MEFLKSINIIRQNMAFPFYSLLFGVPLCMTVLLYVAGNQLSPEESFFNFYTGVIYFLLSFVNLCFWKKLHWQRLGNPERAEAWHSAVDKMVILLFIAIIVFN